jgi:hypothetical protein
VVIEAMECKSMGWTQLLCPIVGFCEVNDNPSDVTKPGNLKKLQYMVAQTAVFFNAWF